MGYRRKIKTYRLQFEGEYEGLEVHMSGLTTGEFLDIVYLGKTKGDEDSDETTALLKSLAKHLISWNLEDDEGVPVPSDFEGIKTNDLAFNLKIIDAWTGAVGDVPAPLPQTSPSGVQFPEVPVPMEVLSSSPQNSGEPNGSSTSAVSSTFSPAQS